MYEMRRRKPVPTLLPTQRIFNLPQQELAFDDVVHSEKMDCNTAKAVMGFIPLYLRVTNPIP